MSMRDPSRQHLLSYVVVSSYVAVVAAIALFGFAWMGDTEKADLYFKTCSGEWVLAEAAQGMPDATPQSFAASSTLWSGGNTFITCDNLSALDIEGKGMETLRVGVSFFVKKIEETVEGAPMGNSTSTVGSVQAAAVDEVAAEEVIQEIVQEIPAQVQEELVVVPEPPIVAPTSTVKIIETPTTTAPIAEATSTLVTATSTESVTEIAVPPEEPALIAFDYSYDGVNWQRLGTINQNSVDVLDFPVPISSSVPSDLMNFRVRATGLLATSTHAIYVDNISAQVTFKKNKSVEFAQPVSELSNVLEQQIEKSESPIIRMESETIVPKKVITVDPNAQHTCTMLQRSVRLVPESTQATLSVQLFNPALTTSTLMFGDLPQGVSITFEQNTDQIELGPTQTSAEVQISVVEKIDPRSFDIPIIYRVKRGDSDFSDTTCQLNLIVE